MKGHIRIREEEGHLQFKQRGLKRNKTYGHLDLAFLASRTVRKYAFSVKATQPTVFCFCGTSKTMQGTEGNKLVASSKDCMAISINFIYSVWLFKVACMEVNPDEVTYDVLVFPMPTFLFP